MENKMFNEEDTRDATVYWNKIWDLLLRSLKANRNEESGRVPMRCFVKRNKMLNANGILKLYLTKTSSVGWTRNMLVLTQLRQLCVCVSPQKYSSALTLDSSSSASTSLQCYSLLSTDFVSSAGGGDVTIVQDIDSILISWTSLEPYKLNYRFQLFTRDGQVSVTKLKIYKIPRKEE
ncbi:uncharacterized protein LOC109862877 [Pseudomyrmex gracilis]|uniref:uncharacterized protein LOC109862877 n=1 Tax=Pseudomyrmex gracilis TaxID=219809 RepID=UPI0009949220|nr:uncharacterized protein LOC109862877 [Pseudomyrmex gracilis]